MTLALTEAFSQSEWTLPVPQYLAGDPQSRAIEVDFAQLDGKASPGAAGASPEGAGASPEGEVRRA